MKEIIKNIKKSRLKPEEIWFIEHTKNIKQKQNQDNQIFYKIGNKILFRMYLSSEIRKHNIFIIHNSLYKELFKYIENELTNKEIKCYIFEMFIKHVDNNYNTNNTTISVYF